MSIPSNLPPVDPRQEVGQGELKLVKLNKGQAVQTIVERLGLTGKDNESMKVDAFKSGLATMMGHFVRLDVGEKVKYKNTISDKKELIKLFKLTFGHAPTESQKSELSKLPSALYERSLKPIITHKKFIEENFKDLIESKMRIINEILEDAAIGIERPGLYFKKTTTIEELTNLLKNASTENELVLGKFFRKLRQKPSESEVEINLDASYQDSLRERGIIQTLDAKSRKRSSIEAPPTETRGRAGATAALPLKEEIDILTKDFKVSEIVKAGLSEALKALKRPYGKTKIGQDLYEKQRETVLSELEKAVRVKVKLTDDVKTNLTDRLSDVEFSWILDVEVKELLKTLGKEHVTKEKKAEIKDTLKKMHERTSGYEARFDELDVTAIPLYELENIHPAKIEISKTLLGNIALENDSKLSEFLWKLVDEWNK